MNRNRKKAQRGNFHPFAESLDTDGPAPYGRAAEKHEWMMEVEDELSADSSEQVD